MKIGFDISQTGSGKAGCGYFAHSMIEAMLEFAPVHSYSLYPSFGDFYFDSRMPLNNPYKGKLINYGPRHISRESAGVFWSKATTEIDLGTPDIIHSNNFWCPAQFKSSRLIYTFYDMGFVVDPNWTTETNRVGCFNGVFRSALSADWVVAISEASRSHYLSIFPHFPEHRIRVIYPCSRFADPTLKSDMPKALENIPEQGFWLNVGTIEPRKNQYRLIEAYARYLALGGHLMPLVLAGGKGWLMDDFQKHLKDLNVEDHVLMIGYVTDEELLWLYQNCYANLYPSLFEGFGLPVLEGMQFGAPTITSLTSSIPEVAGKAAILLEPEDVEGWARAMYSISTNKEERSNLSLLALKQANKFNWKNSASALLQLYEEAIASPKRRIIK